MRLLLAALLLLAPKAHAIQLSLASPSVVGPGQEFAVVLFMGQGESFNTYQARITFDPGIVSFAGTAEGALMTSSCPQTWRWEAVGSCQVAVVHSTLCPRCIEGPGPVYVFRFRALHPGAARFSLDGLGVACAGIEIPSTGVGCGVNVTGNRETGRLLR